jgi:hypothetical protein
MDGDETLAPADEPFPIPSLADIHVPGYELLAELGRGAMGVVYRARETKLGRPVALKMILAGGHASVSDRARFKREAEAVAALRHPNIVQIYAVGESGGLPYCALEFVEGGNLADYAAGKALPPQQAAALVEQLARAVHFAHEHNIVHRDLKPANILIADSAGQLAIHNPQSAIPKIADFGLAKKLDSATGPTVTGAVLGTPAYMAPEQAGGEGKTVGPAADTYALGAILYELLTGRPPFRAATPLDTIFQVISVEPPPPRAVNPKVPRDLETVTLKCLRKEPGKRYASAKELAEDLRRWRAGEPVTARPRGRGERMWRGLKRRRRLLTTIIGCSVLTALGCGILGYWLFTGYEANLAEQILNQPPPSPIAVPAAPQIPVVPAAPTVVTAANLEQAKASVVAIAAKRGEVATSGTGFLAVEPGIVVTTLSVLGMDHPLTPPPDRIDVTLFPGLKSSHTTLARLLSVDRNESLASLQISAIGLPPPFALGQSTDIQAGQHVFVAGTPPIGPAVRPTMTTRLSQVSGRILTVDKRVKYIQIEGGNRSSGSALIAADGRLVGVMVASAPGINMGFAIPVESVGGLLQERIRSLRLGQAIIAGDEPRLPVTARVADPLNRVWKFSLDVWTANPGPIRPAAEGKPQTQPGDGERRSVPLNPRADDAAGPGEDRDFVGTVGLPPLPPGKVYLVQPHFRTTTGKEHWGEAYSLPDAGPPVERGPIRLTLNPSAWPTAERRLDLNVVRQMSFNMDGRGDASHALDYSATLAEQSAAADAGAAATARAHKWAISAVWRI